METYRPTTPFGRRPVALAHLAESNFDEAALPEQPVHKWELFRAVCRAKARLGINERALAVLDALLSFHPETALTRGDLIVFPSNEQLSIRAHGMAPSTLRRHLAALVEAGLIARRDSPNGKRYARRGEGGALAMAFGFDLGPLLAKAAAIQAMADEIAAEERARRLAKERVSLCRRDIAKMIATGIDENVPVPAFGGRPATWPDLHRMFRAIVEAIPRQADRVTLENAAQELAMLADEILNILTAHANSHYPSANESQNERHKQNSKPDHCADLEPRFQESRADGALPETRPAPPPTRSYPLGMVLEACPDIVDYAKGGIGSWRDLVATASVVRSMLGISPSAWQAANDALGEADAAVVVAAILQRADDIRSPGGYLRSLTAKAEAGEFSLGPVLMALIAKRARGRDEKRIA